MPVVRPSQSRSRRNRRTVALKPPGYRISAEVTLALLREGHREAGSGHVPRGSPRSKTKKVDHVDRVKVKNSPWYLFLHIYCVTAPCDSRLFSLLLLSQIRIIRRRAEIILNIFLFYFLASYLSGTLM